MSTGHASAAAKWCSHLRRGPTLRSMLSKPRVSGSSWQGRKGSSTSSKAGRRPAEAQGTLHDSNVSHHTRGSVPRPCYLSSVSARLAKGLDHSARSWQAETRSLMSVATGEQEPSSLSFLPFPPPFSSHSVRREILQVVL